VLSRRKTSIRWIKGNYMGGTGKKSENPDKEVGKPKNRPRPPFENDDVEDGDIATPKRDRYGEDDEPL
jgi:hypothetical protein